MKLRSTTLRRARLRALLAAWSLAADRGDAGEADYARWERRRMPEADEHEYRARLREVPDDTRGLTARICGDPLPGRSALAHRDKRI